MIADDPLQGFRGRSVGTLQYATVRGAVVFAREQPARIDTILAHHGGQYLRAGVRLLALDGDPQFILGNAKSVGDDVHVFATGVRDELANSLCYADAIDSVDVALHDGWVG